LLGRSRAWLANRWAYFWLFMAGIGVPLYVLAEPEPLWWSPARRAVSVAGRQAGGAPVAGPLLRGGRGFVLALAVSALTGIVTVFVN